MVRKFQQTITSLILLTILGLTLFLGWSLPTVAQIIPGLSWSENDIGPESNIPVFKLGNLEVAPVFLDGKVVGAVESFIELKNLEQESSVITAASRSHLIHSKLQKILNNISRYSQQILPQQGITELEAQERELRKQLVITISEKNGNKVVLVTFPQDDVPEIVYTVTKATIERPRFGGSQPLQIAETVANKMENAFIQAWQERQTPHLLSQARQAILILVALTGTSLILAWSQKQLDSQKRRLKNSLAKTESIKNEINSTSNPLANKIFSSLFERKLSLNQRYSLNSFYQAILFWTQWLVWMMGIGYLTSLFYWTRPLTNWIIGVSFNGVWNPEQFTGFPPLDWLMTFGREATLGTPLFVLILMILARLSQTGGNAFCDFLAKYWSEKQSLQRQNLRAPTLARILKGWLAVLTYLLLGLAIVYHLHELGAITQIVAIFLGFFSFAISLASQNLLKDLIGGLLILWEDQYTVGDVIFINDQAGFVENISLRVTQLRNLDGELITIPNGVVGTVRNLTSEWSQLNYAVEVSYDTDVDLALSVIEKTAQELYQDPQWQDQILEAPEMLGVDNVAHTGILIRLLIKTLPLQQWPVGREFRRRLKKAFDDQGIKIGIPKQTMYLNDSFPPIRNNHLTVNNLKD